MKPPAVVQVRQREVVSLCSKRTKVALFTDQKRGKNPLSRQRLCALVKSPPLYNLLPSPRGDSCEYTLRSPTSDKTGSMVQTYA